MKSEPAPRELTLWTAESKTRDFRDATFVPKKVDLQAGETIAEAALPTDGFGCLRRSPIRPQPYPLPLSTTIKVLGAQGAE